MRLIINDKRYAALRSLGERKQAFNEVPSGLIAQHILIHLMISSCIFITPLLISCGTIVTDMLPYIFFLYPQFLSQKKKQEAEERRAKNKKAREDFRKMLEVSYMDFSLITRSRISFLVFKTFFYRIAVS